MGDATPPLTKRVVLIDHGRIQAILPAGTVTDRPIIAPSDATILPGIINAHCHSAHLPHDRGTRWLKHGVTSIGDVGSPLTAMHQLSDSRPGTTTTAAFTGPMLTPPGGYPLPVHNPKYAYTVDSPQTGREAVKKLADQGATMIKISFEPGAVLHPWPLFDPPTASSICDTARKLGLIVRCHVEDLSGLQPALDAGVHAIEHVPHRWFANGMPSPVLKDNNELVPHYRSQLERMVRDGVLLTPTLDVLSRSPWNGPQLFEPVRYFHEMGGRMALGNDFPYRRTDAGMLSNEIQLLTEAGLAPLDVIRTATSGSAMACGFVDRGTITPGAAADLLVVEGNPTENLGLLAQPRHIIKDGVFIR